MKGGKEKGLRFPFESRGVPRGRGVETLTSYHNPIIDPERVIFVVGVEGEARAALAAAEDAAWVVSAWIVGEREWGAGDEGGLGIY